MKNRRVRVRPAVMAASVLALALMQAQSATVVIQPGFGGGGSFDVTGGGDVLESETGRVSSRAAQSAALFTFFPQAGTLWQDLTVLNFVDLDPTAGINAFDCTPRAYDGHNGHDSVIVGFTEQALGVPVFAALDGTVVDRSDGNPDMNTTPSGQPDNRVFLDHGNGLTTRYHHMKNGSVAVALNDVVTAGQQIGLTASSGNSGWPHLHFGTYQDGVLFEPSSGPCRAGASNWANQPSIPAEMRLTSFTFGTGFFLGNLALPFDQVVRRGTFVAGPAFQGVYWRYSFMNMPANPVPTFTFRRPDGTVADTFNGSLGAAAVRWGQHTWGRNIILNITGTWTLEMIVNGALVGRMPFTVTSGEIVNRPPLIASVALDPALPGPTDVTFCRVTPWAVHRRDPDYDVVRYRYTWVVNGATVRDIYSAGLSDALPKGLVQSGNTVACTITPNDGVLDGPSSTTNNLSQVNLLQNSDFGTGTAANWSQFATPDMNYIVSNVTSGVFQFYRVAPPPGTSNQAVVFQETQTSLRAGSRVQARFRLGNSDTSRRRISVLIHDGDFSDLSVCTFWMAGAQPLVEYTMLTRTTKAWNHATISLYAASAGSTGGFYQVDDVSLEYLPGGTADRTECTDPNAPGTPGGAPGPERLVNGNFDTGALAPWGLFGQITQQIVGGVFEFVRPSGTPAGVVLQATGQATSAGEIMTATFHLGNSSQVPKRVTILLHDQDFSDLHACTFWLVPGQALAAYTVVTYTTEAWTNATVSFYPSTVGLHQWMRLDNVSFRSTPGAAVLGTGCYEPGAVPPAPVVGIDYPADSREAFASFTPRPRVAVTSSRTRS